MDYTIIFRTDDGRVHERPHVYSGKEPPWTLKEAVWHAKNDFLQEPRAATLEVRNPAGNLIVELTREQFESGAKQYRVEFVEVPDGRAEWRHTGQKAYLAAWSQPLAMELAKELVRHYPPATGFELVDMVSERPLQSWDRSRD